MGEGYRRVEHEEGGEKRRAAGVSYLTVGSEGQSQVGAEG